MSQFDESKVRRDADGQFAPMVTSEGPPLTVDNVYRDDEGSFRYPPLPPTAAQMTHFWCTVDVPEDLLGRMSRSYAAMVDEEKRQELLRWEAQNPSPADSRSPAWGQWESARQQVWDNIRQRYQAKFIPKVYLRPLARVERMWRYSRYLSPQENAAFQKQKWTMPGGASKTAQEWVDTYQLQVVGRALDADSDVGQVEMNDSLDKIKEELTDLRFLTKYGEDAGQIRI